MQRTSWVLLGVGLSAAVALTAQAADEAKPAAKPAATQPTAKPAMAAARLPRPWNEITGLSEEQKQQIAAAHTEALAAIKKVEEQEEAKIVGLLTDEQKAQYKAIRSEAKENLREKTKERSERNKELIKEGREAEKAKAEAEKAKAANPPAK